MLMDGIPTLSKRLPCTLAGKHRENRGHSSRTLPEKGALLRD
jgi:hypothetical protein